MQRIKRWTLIALLFVMVLFLRGCVLRPGNNADGIHFNKAMNAIWLGVEWVSEPQTDQAVAALGEMLVKRDIRYIFAYTTYLKQDGQFNDNYAYAAEFLQSLKRTAPDLKVLAWIGIPLVPGWGYVDLADPDVQQQTLDLATALTTDYPFDGIHLDAEPIHSDDLRVLALLEGLHLSIGAEKMVSIAAPAIFPLFAEQAPANSILGWSAGYYRQVAARVDQIAVMSYDSGISAGANWLYSQWMRFQVIELTKALNTVSPQVEVLLGVPTSEEHTNSHDPAVENIETALHGIISGLNDDEAIPDRVTGIAIYPHWEMDDREWATYESQWLGMQP